LLVHAGTFVSDEAESPFTNPEYEGVIAGELEPYVMDAEDAVITRSACPIVTIPVE